MCFNHSTKPGIVFAFCHLAEVFLTYLIMFLMNLILNILFKTMNYTFTCILSNINAFDGNTFDLYIHIYYVCSHVISVQEEALQHSFLLTTLLY